MKLKIISILFSLLVFDTYGQDARYWLNAGNQAYENHEPLKAIVAWHRAIEKGAGQLVFDAAYNSTIAKKELGISDSNDYSSLQLYLRAIPIIGVQIFIILLLCILLFAAYLAYQKRKYILVGLLYAFCFVLLYGALAYYTLRCQHAALIIDDHATLYNGPDDGYDQMGVIQKATRVTIKECQTQWCKVCFKNRCGWLKKSSIEII